MKNGKTWLIIAVILIVAMIAFAIFASKKSSLPTTTPTTTGGNTQTGSGQVAGQVVTAILDWFKGRKKTTADMGYVQVAPIDERGCDANGRNAIGVRCDMG